MMDYWSQQVERLKSKSNRELNELRIGFSIYKNHTTFGNYYHHIKAEIAERIGRKETNKGNK